MRVFLSVAILLFLLAGTSCRKCFECSSACANCYVADSLVTSFCTDTFSGINEYKEKLSMLENSGLRCSNTKTLKEDFCIHQDEESRYLLYYNNYYCEEK